MGDRIELLRAGQKMQVDENIQELIKKYRLRVPELINYPSVLVNNSGYDIATLAKKYEDILVNVVRQFSPQDDGEAVVVAFELRHKSAIVFAEYLPFLEDPNIMLIFYKDINEVEDFLLFSKTIFKPGVYYVGRGANGWYLQSMDLANEQDPILEDNLTTKLQHDIDTFFTKKEFYKKNKMSFKRGILLYGSAGNGKTCAIRSVLRNNLDKYNIIVDCASGLDRTLQEFLKRVLGDNKKIMVFEDIDGVESYQRSAFLNLLDGVNAFENTLIMATTNYIHKVDGALLNRPSRFDRVYKIELPTTDIRKQLLVRYFPKLTADEIAKYAKETEGFSGAYFKELFIFVNLRDCSLDEAIKDVKKQLDLYGQCAKETTNYLG